MEQLILKGKVHMEDEYSYSESIKTLRTNIRFSGNGINVIMFTSALPGEGKSDTAFSLARSLAMLGNRTVLVDCDIRKSVYTVRYELNREVKGLSQYLTGQESFDDILYSTNFQGFYLILAGPYSPNPTELLEEKAFGEMIDRLRKEFDYVILDTPPMGILTDAAIVAKHCDGTVLVIESGAISRRLEQKVKSSIENTGCRILGVVLNKVEANASPYYSKYGKYGKYGRYGKYSKYSKYESSGGEYGSNKEKRIADRQAYGTSAVYTDDKQ